MHIHLKHKIIKTIEKTPPLQIFIYNNLKYFNFFSTDLEISYKVRPIISIAALNFLFCVIIKYTI